MVERTVLRFGQIGNFATPPNWDAASCVQDGELEAFTLPENLAGLACVSNASGGTMGAAYRPATGAGHRCPPAGDLRGTGCCVTKKVRVRRFGIRSPKQSPG